MNLLKLAFKEFFQAYKYQFTSMRKNWRKKIAIKVANSEFIRTGIQHYVLKHDKFDCEVLSKRDLDRRLLVLKKTGQLPKTVTIYDIKKEAIYVTPDKIYSGNLTALGVKIKK